ncbi:MAG TPA: hypothetical protein VMK12_02925 [Anaeromyxobacteraceae bacterium]|nr:hypothetical protein [Anaeromyxobacteraceae bacterium]
MGLRAVTQRSKQQKLILQVPKRTTSQSADNFAVHFTPPAKSGDGTLVIAYEGPLASGEALVARAGVWREGGTPWTETREVALRREGRERWEGDLPIPAGSPVRAVEFVVRAGERWDNGGRAPLGYYEWSVGERELRVL